MLTILLTGGAEPPAGRLVDQVVFVAEEQFGDLERVGEIALPAERSPASGSRGPAIRNRTSTSSRQKTCPVQFRPRLPHCRQSGRGSRGVDHHSALCMAR